MEQLKHECGVAMIRLLKPLDYYQKKYGTWMYGLNKLYLMMEKQHNRGQEGAGIACVNCRLSIFKCIYCTFYCFVPFFWYFILCHNRNIRKCSKRVSQPF